MVVGAPRYEPALSTITPGSTAASRSSLPEIVSHRAAPHDDGRGADGDGAAVYVPSIAAATTAAAFATGPAHCQVIRDHIIDQSGQMHID